MDGAAWEQAKTTTRRPPSPHLQAEVDADNAKCAQRQALYQSIAEGGLPLLPPPPLPPHKSVSFCLVPAAWLRACIQGIAAAATGLSLPTTGGQQDRVHASYLCPHDNGLDPQHISNFKVITPDAYDAIIAGSFSPLERKKNLFDQDCYRCETCATQRIAYSNILHLVDNSDDAGPQYWLDNTWREALSQLCSSYHQQQQQQSQIQTRSKAKGKKNGKGKGKDKQNAKGQATTGSNVDVRTPNRTLRCQHSEPVPHYHHKAIRVSESAWKAIGDAFPDACVIPNDAKPCTVCSAEANARTAQQNDSTLSSLAQRTSIFPPAFQTFTWVDKSAFRVVDSIWLAQWRRYITDQDACFPAPPALTNAALRCRCCTPTNNGGDSPRLALVAPVLEWITSQVPLTTLNPCDLEVYQFPYDDVEGGYPRVEIISVAEWETLVTAYPAAEEELYTLALQYFAKEDTWHFHPTLCQACKDAVEQQEDEKAKNYQDKLLHIVFFRDEGDFRALFPNTATTTTSTTSTTPTPTPTPSRSASGRGKKRREGTITAASTDSLEHVGLLIYEALSLEPTNQRLFNSRGRPMLDDNSTLADCEVQAGKNTKQNIPTYLPTKNDTIVIVLCVLLPLFFAGGTIYVLPQGASSDGNGGNGMNCSDGATASRLPRPGQGTTGGPLPNTREKVQTLSQLFQLPLDIMTQTGFDEVRNSNLHNQIIHSHV